ncbi:protein tfg-1-like isoform X1 [Gallus gallus]|uniref:protein tfg-1-like isoform X1 n=1 Tax=Gallus gallus TaxID=9031 RepID=UPI001F01B04E|nr:protein tfg-1-like isoform X1 [Gallus gallus]
MWVFFFFFFFRAKGSICHCASPPARPHRYQPLPLSRPSRDERPSPGAHACPRPPRGGVGGAEGPPRPGATPVPGRFPRRGPEPPPGGGVTCGPAAGGNGVAVAAGTPPPPGHARSGHRGCSAGVCATEGRGEAEIFSRYQLMEKTSLKTVPGPNSTRSHPSVHLHWDFTCVGICEFPFFCSSAWISERWH